MKRDLLEKRFKSVLGATLLGSSIIAAIFLTPMFLQMTNSNNGISFATLTNTSCSTAGGVCSKTCKPAPNISATRVTSFLGKKVSCSGIGTSCCRRCNYTPGSRNNQVGCFCTKPDRNYAWASIGCASGLTCLIDSHYYEEGSRIDTGKCYKLPRNISLW